MATERSLRGTLLNELALHGKDRKAPLKTMQGAAVSLDEQLQLGLAVAVLDRKGLTERLGAACNLPPYAKELTPIYTKLTTMINTPDLHGRDYQGTIHDVFTAIAISNILLYQTSLQAVDKHYFSGDRWDRRRALDLEDVLQGYSRSDEALEARRTLQKAALGFIGLAESQFAIASPSRNEVRMQAAVLDDLLIPTAVSDLESESGDPEWDDRMKSMRLNGFHVVASHPEAGSMMVNGDFVEISSAIRSVIFIKAAERALEDSDHMVEPTMDALASYFLNRDDDSLQASFWSIVDAQNETSLDIANWFFGQGELEAGRFLTSAGWHGFSLARERKNLDGYLRRLTGMVAGFQGNNADHPNLPKLHASLGNIGGLFQRQEIMNPLLAVLGGEEGIIYLNSRGEAKEVARRTGEGSRAFGARVARFSPRTIYTNVSEETVSDAPVPHAPLVRNVSEKVAAPSPTLILSGGELAIKQSRWPDAQLLEPAYRGRLYAHVDTRLAREGFDGNQTSELIEQISAFPAPSKEVLRNFPTVFPSLLADSHWFRFMDHLGIQSIESSNRTVTVVFDAKRAGIDTHGPDRVLIRGTMNSVGEFVFEQDIADSPDSNLQLLVTFAARTAMQHAGKEQTVTSESIRGIQDTVRGYNSRHRGTGEPMIEMPRRAQSQLIKRMQDYVLVPTEKKGETVLLKLSW